MKVYANDKKTVAIKVHEVLDIVAAYGLKNVLCCESAGIIETEELVEIPYQEFEWEEECYRELPMTPYDKDFDGDLCHATGYEYLDGGTWWTEFVDNDGNYHYGN